MLKHPESNALWQVPISYKPSRIELSFLEPNKTTVDSGTDSTLQLENDEDDFESNNLVESSNADASELATRAERNDQSTSKSDIQKSHPIAEKAKPGRGKLAGAYILATRSAIDEVLELKPSKFNHLYPLRWKNYFGRDLVKRGYWREDMGLFIHVLIRRKVKRHLAHLAQLEQYVHRFTSKKLEIANGATVLWLDAPTRIGRHERFEEFIQTIVSGHDYISHSVHPTSSSFVLHSAKGKVLSIFNLPSLIGEDGVAWLRDRNAIFRELHTAIIYDKRHTAEAVSWLWRLVNYRSEEDSRSLTDVGKFKERKELSEAPEEEAGHSYLLGTGRLISEGGDEVLFKEEEVEDKCIKDVP